MLTSTRRGTQRSPTVPNGCSVGHTLKALQQSCEGELYRRGAASSPGELTLSRKAMTCVYQNVSFRRAVRKSPFLRKDLLHTCVQIDADKRTLILGIKGIYLFDTLLCPLRGHGPGTSAHVVASCWEKLTQNPKKVLLNNNNMWIIYYPDGKRPGQLSTHCTEPPQNEIRC
jgi:hypothetical protein